MKKLCHLLPLLVFFAACKSKKPADRILSPSNLPSQYFSVDPSRDTVLNTSHGSFVKIPAGSIKAEAGEEAIVEIKEAFTPAEILQAGLTTVSNGKSLSSAGMIYVNATVNDKKTDLLKPLPISLPATSYDPEMRIFKGEYGTDSVINWINPSVPDTSSPTDFLRLGQAIYESKCRSCHSIYKAGTGPYLKDVDKRGPWTDRKNIYAYIRNPTAFTATNKYAQQLKAVYGSMMTAFPDLHDSDTDAILFYLNSQKPGKDDRPCYYDTSYAEEIPDHIRGSKADTLNHIDASQFNTDDDTTDVLNTQPVINAMAEADTNIYEAEAIDYDLEDYQPDVYLFEIENFGWYNVDAFIENYPGLVNIKISGSLINYDPSKNITIQLFSPKKKISQYVIEQDGKDFNFNKSPEGIPFFLNEKVILVAVGQEKGTTQLGVVEFVTKKEQVVNITLKPTPEKDILKKLSAIKEEGLKSMKRQVIIMPRWCDDSAQGTQIVRDTAIKKK